MSYTLYDFWAPWQKSCATMEPIVNKWASENSYAQVERLDYDTNPDLVAQYNIDIIPSFILVKDGYEMRRCEGAVSQQAFDKALYVDPSERDE